ncbi:AraC family transcriptional regulator [Pontibacter mangrovi]|nr:AraC family transcriptional regulator [Pontibacter mangrovi]
MTFSTDFPIYKVDSFTQASITGNRFYLSSFEDHIKVHTFLEKPHRHDFYTIILFTQGCGEYTIDFKKYPISKGTVFFLSPGQLHKWQVEEEVKGFIIFFNPDFYLLEHPNSKLYSFPFFNALSNDPLIPLSETGLEQALDVVRLMEREYQMQAYKQDEVIGDFLDVLLILLARSYKGRTMPEKTSTRLLSQIRLLESLVEEHFTEHQPVTFYAERLHVTPKHLNTICKAATGRTTVELVQQRTVLEAKRLLAHSNYTVSEIASKLGYTDNSYFSRFFKKHARETPEQFRKSCLF